MSGWGPRGELGCVPGREGWPGFEEGRDDLLGCLWRLETGDREC